MTKDEASYISLLKSINCLSCINTIRQLPPRSCVEVPLRLIILGLSLWQAVYGLMQLLGLRPSLHHLYPVTGSFYNPGPYACFLALTFPLALAETLRGRSILRWLASALLLLDAILLPVTLSRTAWLGCLLGSLTLFLPEIASLFRRRRILIPLSAAGMLLLSVALFTMKESSARGRILMWKVAVTAIDRRPFNGVGPDRVAGTYGDAQERYFSSPRPEKETLVADAPDYIFNEYLQTALAFGWGTLLILILILVGALAVALHGRNLPMAGCTVAAMTVMTASYPFQFPISAAVIALILVSAFLSTTILDISILGSVAAVAVCAILCSPVDRQRIHTGFNTGLTLHKAGKWRKSNETLLALLPYTSDPMPLNIIGKNYSCLAMPDSAAHYLLRAACRCPNRLYPHYLLMNLYADSLPSEAMREARTLTGMRVKVPSPATDEMRRNARKLINRLENENL